MEIVRQLCGIAATIGCDLHHWGGHHSSGGSNDPAVDAFVVALFVAAGLAMMFSFAGSGLLLLFTKRIGPMFWAVPLLNLAAYLIYLLVRDYPGGWAEQFRGIGLVHTILGTLILLILTLVIVSLQALVRFILRKFRQAAEKRQAQA